MIKVSVIVPVYNVEEYLEKCLDSLVNQTLKDIEIIVVNDGTPDNSQQIIDRYEKKYKNIKSYIKENGGLSDTRNFGIKQATGEYIAFVDGDDYVSYDMYELMYNKAKSGNFDMVVCDLNYVYSETKIKEVSSKIERDTTNIKQAYINIYPCVWNKIYKKKLFNNDIEFKKSVWFEDVDFLYKMLPFVKNIGVVKKPLNQYVQRMGSISKTFDKRLYNYIDNFNDLIEFYKERNFYDEYYRELEYCYVRYVLATFVKQATNYNREEYGKAVDTALKNVRKNFPHYRKNKYFYQSIKGIYLILFNKHIANLLYKIEGNK